MTHSIDRRRFVASLGAISATQLLPESLSAADARGIAAPGDFLMDKGRVFLNTGSLGPSPRQVLDAATDAWKTIERDPVSQAYGPMEDAMNAVRAKGAALLGCSTNEIVLTRSTTEGMNWIALGLTFSPGDRILTTDQEHPGGSMCWQHVARRFGVGIDKAVITPGEHDAKVIVDRIASMMTARTRVLSFSHLLSSTGLRMPVAELCALARSRGCISVVDGAQAVGGIAVNVKALGCDVYATSGHKWLLGPPGTGMLYLNDDTPKGAIDLIALQDSRAAYSGSSGVTNIPGVIGLGAAIDYHNARGTAAIESHNMALRNQLYERIKFVSPLEIVSPPPGSLASPLLTYRLPDAVPAPDLAKRLHDRHKVVVKVVPTFWFNGQRISTHLFNTERDLDALIAALKTELAAQ